MKQDLVALLPRLRRFALSMTGSVAEADDLVQEACFRALSRKETRDPNQPLDRWVFRILRNLWTDEIRKRQVRLGQGLVQSDETQELQSHQTGESYVAEGEIRRSISDLPQELSSVLLLVAVEGYSYAETSSLLDVPIGTVMSRLHRARKTLAQTYTPSEEVRT